METRVHTPVPAGCKESTLSFFFFGHAMGIQDLSSLTRIEPTPPAVEAKSLLTTAREVPLSLKTFLNRKSYTFTWFFLIQKEQKNRIKSKADAPPDPKAQLSFPQKHSKCTSMTFLIDK